jgi:AcrR family transcriptional regulator
MSAVTAGLPAAAPGPAARPGAAAAPGPAPAPGPAAAPRTSLDCATIVDAAMAIADDEGFEAVSMRRVASRLGVGTMTLYSRVRDKDELLDLMWDALLAEHLLPEDVLAEIGTDWRTGLAEIARRGRRSFLRHPWALGVGMRPGLGRNKLRHVEQALTLASGLTDDTRAQRLVAHAVDDLVAGCTLRELAAQRHLRREGQPCGLRELLDAQPDLQEYVRAGDFPHLRAVLEEEGPPAVDRFEQSLAWLLDGIERTYAVPEYGSMTIAK